MTTSIIQAGYKIGPVSRITGIGSETLRAWERRYSAVTPTRSDSGDRQYSRDDVAKLLLLKSLVDAGISIGSIAEMSLDELKQRVKSDPIYNNAKLNEFNHDKANDEICRVALIGDGFHIRVLDGLSEVQGIQLIGEYENIEQLKHQIETKKDSKGTLDIVEQADVIILERPTINQQTKTEIQQLRDLTGAWHVVLMYGFSTKEMIEGVQSGQTTVVRSSIDVQELARLCIYHSGGSEKLPSLEEGSTLHFEQTIPTRSFSNKQLVELAQLSNAIKCECPKHVTDLVRDLVAFEIYSAECENESPEDAALHAYLHATTAQARSILESALSHLIRVEGLSIKNS